MNKEASRIRRVVSRLSSREDLTELVALAKAEMARGRITEDRGRYDRGVAILKVASEALANAKTFGQYPRGAQAA